jgi:polyketide biosynthesis enoyl-CoA hydratase PksH
MTYRTIRTRVEGTVSYLQLDRPEANNTINRQMVEDCLQAIALCEESASVLVLEGSAQVFCFGADFGGLRDGVVAGADAPSSAQALYELWERIAYGPFVSVAHVRGQVNAGGVGFVAACDVVLADASARFGLSELLFGLYPACVMPFLIRRIGMQRANYMTVTTLPVGVEQACSWGLVDAWQAQSHALLHRHLLRLQRLSKPSIARYKQYLRDLCDPLSAARALAVRNNHDMHLQPGVMEGIVRYVETGKLPWEKP